MFAAPAVTPAPILAAAAGAGELDLRQVTAFTTSSVVGASNPYSYYGTYNAACGVSALFEPSSPASSASLLPGQGTRPATDFESL